MSVNLIKLPTLNAQLLTDLVKWAAADEDALQKAFAGWGGWNQGVWAQELRNGACETSYCIAGQAVTQAGFAMAYVSAGYEYADDGHTLSKFTADYCYPAKVVGVDERTGKQVYGPDTEQQGAHIRAKAEELLGLTYEEADALFEGENALGNVIWYALHFAEQRGITLDLPEDIKERATGPYVEYEDEDEDYEGEDY